LVDHPVATKTKRARRLASPRSEIFCRIERGSHRNWRRRPVEQRTPGIALACGERREAIQNASAMDCFRRFTPRNNNKIIMPLSRTVLAFLLLWGRWWARRWWARGRRFPTLSSRREKLLCSRCMPRAHRSMNARPAPTASSAERSANRSPRCWPTARLSAVTMLDQPGAKAHR
jgi:hypothetical protein